MTVPKLLDDVRLRYPATRSLLRLGPVPRPLTASALAGSSGLCSIEPRAARGRDLARGLLGFGLWAAPISVLLLGSAGGQSGFLNWNIGGALVVVGSLWLGLTCLANAARCGRTHCWIDGMALPVLAVGALVWFLIYGSAPWNLYLSAVWGVIVVSFVAECIAGPYIPIVTRGASR